MNSLSINGVQTGGKVYALNLPQGQNINDVKKAGENDGLDQVYFEANGSMYVVEGDGLTLSGLDREILPTLEFVLDGKTYDANYLAHDNETNTAFEGIKSVGLMAASLTGLSTIGGAISRSKLVSTSQTLTSSQQTLKGLSEGAQALQGAVGKVQQALKPLSAGESITANITKPYGSVNVKMGPNYAPRMQNLSRALQQLGQAENALAQAGEKIANLQKGASPAVKQGLEAYQKSVQALSSQVSASKISVGASHNTLKEMPRIFKSSFSKIPSGMNVTQTISAGGISAPHLDKALAESLKAAEGSTAQVSKASQAASKASTLARRGLYAAGIGLGVAGVTVIGAAIYGATKSEDSGLDAYRQELP